MTPSQQHRREAVGKAVNERWISPTQGLDLLTAALCQEITDNALRAPVGREKRQ